MYYIRYRLHSLDNAMLEYAGTFANVMSYYRLHWNEIVFCQLWNVETGFVYTIV